MKRIILLLAVMLFVVAMMVATAPAMAQPQAPGVILIQQDKTDQKTDQQKTDQKGKEEKNLPASGGIPVGSIALLGLGAAVLLVGGGLLVRRITR